MPRHMDDKAKGQYGAHSCCATCQSIDSKEMQLSSSNSPSSNGFNPGNGNLHLTIDFSLLWAFNLARGTEREGGGNSTRGVLILSKASFRLMN